MSFWRYLLSEQTGNTVPLLVMVHSTPEASEGPSARAKHQLWCVRVRNFLTPPPRLSLFPNSLRRRWYFPPPGRSHSHSCLRQQAGAWLCICFFYYYISSFFSLVYRDRGFLPGSPRTSGRLSSPRHTHSAWGMRGLPERNSRNSHVWMDKRIESEATAAEMEENTLPDAPSKSVYLKARMRLFCWGVEKTSRVLCHTGPLSRC